MEKKKNTGSIFDSTIEAFRSFLRVPANITEHGSHVRDCNDLKRVMSAVIVALLPTFLFAIYNIGYQHNSAANLDMGFWQMAGYGLLKILPLYLVSYIVGLAIEFASAHIRHRQVNEGYLVTGMLIPLIVPINIPLWMLALAVAFSVIFGKEVFGGTGMNIWNPALVARAFLFFAYPKYMTGDTVWVAGVDGYSGATSLATAAAGGQIPSTLDMFTGLIPGCPGETSIIAILIGAALLLYFGVASWKIMLSSVIGALAVGYICNWAAPDANSFLAMPAWKHLLMGSFAFGTVFMATDPVTSTQTETGKWIYGFFTGALIIVIRLFNPGYPEGTMLSILLMNTFAPLIDYIVIDGNIRKRLKRARIK